MGPLGSIGIIGPDWDGGMWGGVGPPPLPDKGLDACSWTPMGDGWGDMYPMRERTKQIQIDTYLIYSHLASMRKLVLCIS